MAKASGSLALERAFESTIYTRSSDISRRRCCECSSGVEMYSLLCLGRLLEPLCFALLPHVFDCLKEKHGPMVICVSPLTSLMMDQTENFSRTS